MFSKLLATECIPKEHHLAQNTAWQVAGTQRGSAARTSPRVRARGAALARFPRQAGFAVSCVLVCSALLPSTVNEPAE